MKLYVNDLYVDTQARNIVDFLAEQNQHETLNIAIAVNGEVVHRQAWHTSELHEHDRLDIFTAIAGG